MQQLLTKLKSLEKFVKDTPVRELQNEPIHLYVKLEYNNYTGSIKDRPAYNILYQGIKEGKINQHSTIVESSSGNLAIALSHMCKKMDLNFIPVIDPNINRTYENTLQLLCNQIVKVTELDETQGYLLTRIENVKNICTGIENSFWTNQYNNKNNYLAYQSHMSQEIFKQVPDLDYLFVAVSSGGTVTGLSRELKKLIPGIKVIAVDVDGSVAFDKPAKRRLVSGIGSSQRSRFLEKARIDDVVMINQKEIVHGAYELLQKHQLFAGASTGAAYSAIKQYLRNGVMPNGSKVMFIATDKGHAYIDNIYNKEWYEKLCEITEVEEGVMSH